MTPLYFFIGLALLYVGGEVFVRSAAAIGKRLHMSPLVAGLTIVAFATSAPELAIALNAALNELPGLAIGNVIGSNICNLALILGIVIVIRPASLRQAVVQRDAIFLSIATLVVPGLLLVDGQLGRADGSLLLLCIVAYLVLTLWHVRVTRSQRSADEHTVPMFTENVPVNLLLAIAGVGLLIAGSHVFVEASVKIAEMLGVPNSVVGLSAAALGSSLPELSASVVAAKHAQPEMAAGNLIGSNIFNLLLILGATSVTRPLAMTSITLIDIAVMILITALALGLIWGRPHLGRRGGVTLIAAYVAYIIWIYVQ
jgi:cation:H+ antiporter